MPVAIVRWNITLRLKSITKIYVSEVEGHAGWSKSHWCKRLGVCPKDHNNHRRLSFVKVLYYLQTACVYTTSTNIIVINYMRWYIRSILQMKSMKLRVVKILSGWAGPHSKVSRVQFPSTETESQLIGLKGAPEIICQNSCGHTRASEWMHRENFHSVSSALTN